MIFDPVVMALLLVASLGMAGALAGGLFAAQLLRQWNPASGDARQIALERRTHLAATVLRLLLLAQMAALVLFVHNADRMAILFTGAMCALGTLNVNAYGMPAFLLMMAVFFLAALWLLVDAADREGRDYPLTRLKYGLLLMAAPVLLASGILQWLYFLNLDPNVITSCCSKLFTPEGSGVQAELSALPPASALTALFGGLALLAGLAALASWRPGTLAYAAYGLSGTLFFAVAIVAIISVISPYIYDTPVHHCPFCILKPQYGFIGYALYGPLFGASALALGVALLALWPAPASLHDALPHRMRRMTVLSAVLFALFALANLYAIATSDLILFH